MSKSSKQSFKLPDAEGWREIEQNCRLSEGQLAALRATLEEAEIEIGCFGAYPSDRAMKAALKKIDRLLDRLQRTVACTDVSQALAAIETHGAFGYLLSSTITTELLKSEGTEVPMADIERLLTRKRFKNEPILASDLDALCLQNRQRLINQATPQAVDLVILGLRSPISAWLLGAGQDKGGNRLRKEREVLTWLLARDSTKILGKGVTSSTNNDFVNLCTWVFTACDIDTAGLEDAVARCLDRHKEWLKWQYLPTYNQNIAKEAGA